MLLVDGLGVQAQTVARLATVTRFTLLRAELYYFGRYSGVRNTQDLLMSNALQTSSATLGVAVAVRQTTRSALTSLTKRET